MGPRVRGDDGGVVAGAPSSPPTVTPAFANNTFAASFAARAIEGSLRTRSCAIEPSTSRVSWVARPSASATLSCFSRSRNQRRRLSLKAIAIFLTDFLWSKLRDRVDERTAAKALAGETPLQPVEGAEDLFDRRPVGGRSLGETTRQIGRDQFVLGGKVIVQRALADADFGGDGVDADSANAALIKQEVSGFENPLLHGRFFVWRHIRKKTFLRLA